MKENLDILFLGGLFPKETEFEIVKNSIGSVQNAANALQWNLVTGLDQNLQHPVHIVNALYVGSYPKRYKKALINTYRFSHIDGAQDINAGFCNLCGLKFFTRERCIRPFLKEWAQQGETQKVIIAYAMTTAFVKAISYIKMLNPKIKTCLIVPDLPQYMNLGSGTHPLYALLKNCDRKSICRNLHNVDCYVLLTEHMRHFMHAEKYVVVEGISSDFYHGIQNVSKQEKMIAYTGTLNKCYGVLNLVSAFQQIKDPAYQLVLCGDGDAVAQIEAAARIDHRITFRGLIPREEALRLQMEASVLVNPRKNEEEFTKYSFPSKNLEYLSSGTPMIAYRLDGIPAEYDAFTYYVEDNIIDSLKNTLIDVLSKSPEELHEFGAKAKEFVLREKNNVVQAEKIVTMLSNLMGEP